MLDASQPPVEQEPEEGDPSSCPEDEEFFVRPDVAGIYAVRTHPLQACPRLQVYWTI